MPNPLFHHLSRPILFVTDCQFFELQIHKGLEKSDWPLGIQTVSFKIHFGNQTVHHSSLEIGILFSIEDLQVTLDRSLLGLNVQKHQAISRHGTA